VDKCCSLTGQCSNVAVDCDDNNMCTSDSCNPASGCCNAEIIRQQIDRFTSRNRVNGHEQTPVDRNDYNACTTDSRNDSTGGCVYIPINCNNNNSCTADSCSGGDRQQYCG
jgi:hypothetical protein